MVVSVDRTWAWDADQGLVELADLTVEGRGPARNRTKLLPNGLELEYPTSAIGLAPRDNHSVRYSLLTGELRRQPSALGHVVFEGANNELVTVTPTDRGEHAWWGGVDIVWWGARYVVSHHGESHELPLTHPLGRTSGGSAAQFSDDGEFIAISHSFPDRTEQSVSITQ